MFSDQMLQMMKSEYLKCMFLLVILRYQYVNERLPSYAIVNHAKTLKEICMRKILLLAVKAVF